MPNMPFLPAWIQKAFVGNNYSKDAQWSKFAAEAPPLQVKSVDIETGWFGTGGGTLDGYRSSWRRSQGGSGWANEPVTLETAQNLSAVHACRRIICETLAGLPFQLVQQKTKADKLVFRHDLPISEVMAHGNAERSWFDIVETMTAHMVFQGNAYARIFRRSGSSRSALDLDMLLPEWVTPDREPGYGRIRYRVQKPGQQAELFYVTPGEPQDILHLRGYGYDGLIGYSLLTLARQTLSTGLGLEKNWGRFLANGGRVPYLLKRDQPFNDPGKRSEFRANWGATYSDPHVPVLLEGPTTYQQIGISAKDAQFLESRDFNTVELCRWLGVSPSLIFDLRYANYASLEQLIRSFINFTERGWMDRWKGDFRRCVFTDTEKREGIKTRYDLTELNKGDFKDRWLGYGVGLVNGALNRNEAREMEGFEPKPGLDGYLVQKQMVNVEDAGKGLAQTPNEEELVADDE